MNAYSEALAQLVEDFINTHDLFLDEPEHLQRPADLVRFLGQHDVTVDDSVTQDDLEAVRGLRETLRMIWNAPDASDSQQRLNGLLESAPVTLSLEDASDDAVTLQFTPDAEAAVVDRLAVLCAVGLVGVIQQHGIDRMRACASAPCRDVFIDTSRNKTRRFCSDRCANRYNVAAFRERKR